MSFDDKLSDGTPLNETKVNPAAEEILSLSENEGLIVTDESVPVVEISGLFQFDDLEITEPAARKFPPIDYSYTPLVMEFGKYETAKNSQKLIEFYYLKKDYKTAMDLCLKSNLRKDVQSISTLISCCLSLSLEKDALEHCKLFTKAHRRDTSVMFLVAKVYRLNNMQSKAIPELISSLKARHSDCMVWQELGLNFKALSKPWAGACFSVIQQFISTYPYPSSELVSTFKQKMLNNAILEMSECFQDDLKLEKLDETIISPSDCDFLIETFQHHHIIDSQNIVLYSSQA